MKSNTSTYTKNLAVESLFDAARTARKSLSGITAFAGCLIFASLFLALSSSCAAQTLSPASANLTQGQTQQFVTSWASLSTIWTVNGVQGGNSSIGTVSGSGLFTAPAAISSAISVTVEASSTRKRTASATVYLIPPAPPVITTGSLPNGTSGYEYDAALSASGGVAPYTWSPVSGLLPPGVSLGTTNGVISGTPTASGTYSVTVQVMDSTGLKGLTSLQIVILACGSFGATACSSPLTITSSCPPGGTANSAYTITLSSSGGAPPTNWSIASGALPAGLSISAAGVISGTPSTSGSFNFTIGLSDSAGTRTTKACSISITAASTTSPTSPTTVSSLDQYGGNNALSCAGGAKPHFYTEKIGSHWWFCTPDGHAFFAQKPSEIVAAGSDALSAGPQGVTYNSMVVKKYGTANNYGAWATAQVARMKAWGFNSVGEYSDWYVWGMNAPGTQHLPYETVLNTMRQAAKNVGNYVASPPKTLMNGLDQGYVNPGYYAWVTDLYDSSWVNYTQKSMTNNDAGLNGAKNDPWLFVIETDDRDAFYGWGPGPDYGYSMPSVHIGYLALVTAPTRYWEADLNLVYTDPVLYTKLGLRDFLKSKYGSGATGLAALNTAWGSNYTTWDSAGTQYTGESICAGQWNGSKTSCTATLSHANAGKDSIGIRVNGVLVGGDNINGSAPTTGVLGGPGVASGTITYSSGSITVNLASAPASGANVTVEYIANGFAFGGGLLDENGRGSWVCSDNKGLSNCNPNIRADLDAFLYYYAKQYTSNISSLMHTNFPGILNGCMGTLSNPDGGKTRDAFIKATAEDCDVVYASVGSPNLSPDTTYAQRMLNDTYAAMGANKKPILPQRELVSNGDSPYNAYPCVVGSYICATTQSQRGQAYYDWMSWMVSAKDTVTGDSPIVGLQFWSYMDKPAERYNFGLISNIDNSYDGSEAATGTHACSAPLQSLMCGGEAASYGNSISKITQANSLWLSVH